MKTVIMMMIFDFSNDYDYGHVMLRYCVDND